MKRKTNEEEFYYRPLTKNLELDEEFLKAKTLGYIMAGAERQRGEPRGQPPRGESAPGCHLCMATRSGGGEIVRCAHCEFGCCAEGHFLGACAVCGSKICSSCGRVDYLGRDVLVLCLDCLREE